MTKYRVTKRDGEKFEIEGATIEIDGLGTRIKNDDGKVVFTTPGQVEVVPLDSVTAATAKK